MSRSRLALIFAAAAAIIAAGIGIGAVISGSDAGPQTTPVPSDPATKPQQRLTDPLTGGEVSDDAVIAAKGMERVKP